MVNISQERFSWSEGDSSSVGNHMIANEIKDLTKSDI